MLNRAQGMGDHPRSECGHRGFCLLQNCIKAANVTRRANQRAELFKVFDSDSGWHRVCTEDLALDSALGHRKAGRPPAGMTVALESFGPVHRVIELIEQLA